MVNGVPLTTLERYPTYLNYLRDLHCTADEKISSGAIALALGLGEVLVRKDLAFTSCVGKPRVGYIVRDLIAALEGALRCDTRQSAVIVGVGGLGSALLSYNGFEKYGINVVAAFDRDPAKINRDAPKPVLPMEELPQGVRAYGATLAVLCVPAGAAQAVAERIEEAGVKGILCFAPVSLKLSKQVTVRHVDLAANLAMLNAQSAEE